MRNIGLYKFKNRTVDNFTTDIGIKIRRIINRPLRFILGIATNGKIIVENYPKLKKGKPYIFAATHSMVEEVSAILSAIDRSTYTLIGTTEQLEHNPKIYANWVNGMIYVNRLDVDSRRSSIPKMERVLKSGSSVLVFPEGGWNNTECLPCQKLFASPYILSADTGFDIVPLSVFNEFGKKEIYIDFGEPFSVAGCEKDEALSMLRDKLATMKWHQIENHASHISKAELSADCRMEWMKERKAEYLKCKWTKDVWDEELTVYKDKTHPSPEEVRRTLKNVKVTKYNAHIILPILEQIKEDEKYNFNRFMHENWNK